MKHAALLDYVELWPTQRWRGIPWLECTVNERRLRVEEALKNEAEVQGKESEQGMNEPIIRLTARSCNCHRPKLPMLDPMLDRDLNPNTPDLIL